MNKKDLIEIWRDNQIRLILPDHLQPMKGSANFQLYRAWDEDRYYLKIWMPELFRDLSINVLYIPCKWRYKYYRVLTNG